MDKLHKRQNIQRAKRPLRFLVGGVRFGNHNVGDEAILEGGINIIRKIHPNCEIIVLTDQPRRTAKKLGVKAIKCRFIESRSGKINRIFRALSRVLENFLQAYLALRTDVLVCAGATILSDSPALMLFFASFGVFADKRLVHFPSGMNPGNSPGTLNKVLAISKEFDLFLLRDIDTKKRLVDADFDPNFVQVTIDPAFNIKLVDDVDNDVISVLKNNNKKNLVGIGISNERDCSKYNLPLEWAKVADFIVENFDANIVFLPSNTQEGKDLMIMDDAKKSMLYKEKAYIVDVELSPKDMIYSISKLDMMISSRMHQLIFSCLAETPFVGISRCAKINSFLDLFNMIPAATVRDFKLEKVRPAIESTWEQRKEIKGMIRIKKELLLKKSLETERLFSTFLNNINLTSKPHRSLIRRVQSFLDAFFIRF